MRVHAPRFAFSLVLLVTGSASVAFSPGGLSAQTTGNSGTIRVTVTDPQGAVIPGSSVTVTNPVSGLTRTASTDAAGRAQFGNLPLDRYTVTVETSGFAEKSQQVNVQSVVPVDFPVKLAIAGTTNTVTVQAGGDLVENASTYHTDIDRKLFDKLPIESQSSSLSSLVTLASPGIAADSNGLMHGLGDHAENSFSVDGQPITDQQSKVFSNQVPTDAVQSIQVIEGAPPAEYGDKTSLIVDVTTRSGLGLLHPTGSITSSYGTFGSVYGEFDIGVGSDKFGNFFVLNGLRSGRFLDAPEFNTMHDKGNEENFWDRVDYKFTDKDSLHMNLNYTRSWFQTPNTYDQLNVGATDPLNGNPLPAADQRAQIGTFIVSPTYTRIIGDSAVLNLNPYVRKDYFYYYPSANPFSDSGPIQQESVNQVRTLLNYGVRSDLSFVKGANNFKAGVTYQQTPLREQFGLGVVDPTLNAPCIDANGNSVPGFTDPSQCAAAGYQPNIAANPAATVPFFPALACYDLTRPNPSPNDGCSAGVSGNFNFNGHTVVKETSLYIEDKIIKGPWLFNLGIRGDLYNGLSVNRQAEPRLGISYNVKPTNTVLRLSYARTMETPFNENLIVSSLGCANSILSPLLACTPGVNSILTPGHRNEFHAGFEQSFGQHLVVGGEYLWKYTHKGYDFSVLGNTPIFFPIEWQSSKITGFALNARVPSFHGVSVLFVASGVAARFFPPQVGGAGATVETGGAPFRIDHDEKFNQTTHLQYQPWKRGPWFGYNWRYDSGLVAGSTPFATDTTTPVDLTGFTADQQFEAGLFCGAQRATLTTPLTTCAPSQFGSTLLQVPAPGTENDDHNPPRVKSRSLFDMALGDDDIFKGEKYTWSARVTAINVTNKYALYNFLSTFSGTHYVTPRAITGEVAFHF